MIEVVTRELLGLGVEEKLVFADGAENDGVVRLEHRSGDGEGWDGFDGGLGGRERVAGETEKGVVGIGEMVDETVEVRAIEDEIVGVGVGVGVGIVRRWRRRRRRR